MRRSDSQLRAGQIDKVADVNSDGMPDVVITEGGTYCYSNAGQGYWLVTKLANGSWKLIANGTGILRVCRDQGSRRLARYQRQRSQVLLPGRAVERQGIQAATLGIRGKTCKPPR
jgi:hypothetical protein